MESRLASAHLYDDRHLCDGYPRLEELGVAYYQRHQHPAASIEPIFERIGRLIDLEQEPRTVALVGCGPRPEALRTLLDRGYDAVGIEPVVGSAVAAGQFLGAPDRVRVGSAEQLPLEDGSQRVVVLDAVLEHVDSPLASLAEAYRVLRPGGVLYLSTNNRYALRNGEFRPRLFHWFPAVVKESYVFRHLHYDPTLANFTPRPAVHWFCYSGLCALGRQARFAHFYSPLDLMRPDGPGGRARVARRLLLAGIRRSPWIRALALTLFPSTVVLMLKRAA